MWQSKWELYLLGSEIEGSCVQLARLYSSRKRGNGESFFTRRWNFRIFGDDIDSFYMPLYISYREVFSSRLVPNRRSHGVGIESLSTFLNSRIFLLV